MLRDNVVLPSHRKRGPGIGLLHFRPQIFKLRNQSNVELLPYLRRKSAQQTDRLLAQPDLKRSELDVVVSDADLKKDVGNGGAKVEHCLLANQFFLTQRGEHPAPLVD